METSPLNTGASGSCSNLASDNIPVDPEKVPALNRELSVSDPVSEPGLSSTDQDHSGEGILSRTAVADGSYSVGVQGSSASPVQSLSEGDIGVNEQKSDVESGSDDETLSLRPAMSETEDPVNGDVKSSTVGVQGSSASPVQSLSEGDIGVNEQKSDVESGSDDETLSLRPAMSETKDLVNGDVKSSTVGVQGSSASPVQSLSEGDIGVNGQKSDIESGSDDETLSLSSNSSSSAMSETKDPVNGDDKSCTVGDQVPLELQAQSLSDDDNVQKSGVESGSDDDDTRSLIPPMPETKDPVTDSDDRSSVQDQASKESSILLTVMDLPVSSGIDTPQPKASDEVEYPERLSKELPEVGLVDSRIETWKQIEKDNSS